MRVFELHRDVDETGVSGTGVVAQGVEFEDGSVAVRWGGDWPTSVVFHDAGIDSVRHIHGHNGATRIVWMGYDQQPLPDTPQPIEVTQRGFGIWLKDLEDVNYQRISVSTSSLASEDAVRIYVTAEETSGLSSGCAHLNARQAVAVRDALNAWLLWLGDAAAITPPVVEG